MASGARRRRFAPSRVICCNRHVLMALLSWPGWAGYYLGALQLPARGGAAFSSRLNGLSSSCVLALYTNSVLLFAMLLMRLVGAQEVHVLLSSGGQFSPFVYFELYLFSFYIQLDIAFALFSVPCLLSPFEISHATKAETCSPCSVCYVRNSEKLLGSYRERTHCCQQ
jgi:hypothetical protein